MIGGGKKMNLDGEDEYDFLQKVIIVGDTAVGKTCLLLRFCEDEFTPNFISTIGIDFQAKTFVVDQDRVRMQVNYYPHNGTKSIKEK